LGFKRPEQCHEPPGGRHLPHQQCRGSWSRVYINDPSVPGYTNSLPLAGDKTDITASDTTHAWVIGSQPSNDFIYVYISQDGGTTWTHQNLSIPSAYNSNAMTGASRPIFFGSNDAVLPCCYLPTIMARTSTLAMMAVRPGRPPHQLARVVSYRSHLPAISSSGMAARR